MEREFRRKERLEAQAASKNKLQEELRTVVGESAREVEKVKQKEILVQDEYSTVTGRNKDLRLEVKSHVLVDVSRVALGEVNEKLGVLFEVSKKGDVESVMLEDNVKKVKRSKEVDGDVVMYSVVE